MSSNEVAKPKVGQQVFLVLTLRRPIQYVTATVTKVGRVWVELDNHHRFELSTWRLDGKGYSSPGRAYVSEDAYRAETALNDAWAALRDTVSAHYQAPEGMTLEQIAEAGRVLGLTLKRNAL